MNDFQTAVDLFQRVPQPMQWLMLFVFAAKLITPLTPSRADNNALDWVLRALNWGALNVGRDKNMDEALLKARFKK